MAKKKSTKKGKTHVMLVLDSTGSMQSIKDLTISAFNEYLKTLQNDKDADYSFFLFTFNSAVSELVYDAVPVKKAAELNADTYMCQATTPLYDAIARSINHLGKKKKVVFVVQTDGLENASREYTMRQVFDMITEKTGKGWQFLFLGADQDAWVASEKIGIMRGQTMSYSGMDPLHQREVFRQTSSVTQAYAATGTAKTDAFSKTDLRDDDDDDDKARS